MLDAALQLCACASPVKREDLVRGVGGESARTTIAELCGVMVRDVEIVCLDRCVRNRHSLNKMLGTSARQTIKPTKSLQISPEYMRM